MFRQADLACEMPSPGSSTIVGGGLENSGKGDKTAVDSNIPSGVRKFVLSIWIRWSKLINRIRYISEACMDSDEITDELFDDSTVTVTGSQYNGQNNDNCNCKVCRCRGSTSKCQNKVTTGDASNTRSLPSTVRAHKMITLEDRLSFGDTTGTTSDNRHAISLTSESETTSEPRSKEILMLHENSSQPFIGGEKLWDAQNRAWLTPSTENATIQGQMRLLKKQQAQELRNHVVSRDYPIVYRNLVVQNRALKHPLNLRDLMKVLEVGWNWSRTFDTGSVSQRPNHVN
ncbi:hypothetical protein FOA43_003502 [Brettanomyces nanus]|uniref:Gag1-like clamp domain-containing protein n=1 Tax=Eeniella nana TaxID=13502 RepID=A0A875S483_EENNA|nr:uncharacterized protein FOA43_003502 [Brettanomyces nanus]QPG76116.1 hypothetical protein FOA43_003502 [Brettanomyces nanus]